ncbi:MAG TPA: septum site-determining protein MinC, partial [Chloroflexi bacterium]|nr:septum site-determining protein MinC [Chloroflexota bacterium]
AFFRGGRVILQLDQRPLTEAELLALRDLLERHDIELWVVLSDDSATQRLVRSHGIRTRLPGETAEPSPTAAPEDQQALFVHRTLRSGQSLNYPGHVIVLGDVNPGAEVIAGGNIIIWGRVRGIVHAGAFGDASALICALDLNPSQLRIASHISRSPDERRRKPKPEMAYIRDDHIVAEPWTMR